MFWNKFCSLITIFFLSGLISSAQFTNGVKRGNEINKKMEFKTAFSTNNKPGNEKEVNLNRPFALIPQNYYTQHFGIMCKKELALEKATKIPFRFRLGSLQQCNYLEGKK